MHCAERAVAVASNAPSIFRLFMDFTECTGSLTDGAFKNRFQLIYSAVLVKAVLVKAVLVKAVLVNILWKLKHPLGTNFRG